MSRKYRGTRNYDWKQADQLRRRSNVATPHKNKSKYYRGVFRRWKQRGRLNDED